MTKINRKTKVVLDGRGVISLQPNDHVATGGEGSIYRKSKTIIKLYTDSTRMTQENLVDKIKTLSRLNHRFIASPKGIVFDERGRPIGFYMPFVKGEPLSRVFTNDFRVREGFSDKDASNLVDRMKEVVQFTHGNKMLLVDANEMNWIAKLGGQNGVEPCVIDVDSWAFGQWRAKVIMPSIRDWHTQGFNEQTDWFAWGVVTFQIFSGIHPYKGNLPGYKPGEMERRMKDNASVFSKKVRLNRAVRDFSTIPGRLLDWYVATFQHGKRSVPPSPFDKGVATAQAAQVLRIVNTASANLIFDKIYDGADSVMRVFPCGAVLLKSGDVVALSNGRCIFKKCTPKVEVVRVEGGWLSADHGKDGLRFRYVNEVSLQTSDLDLTIKSKKLLRYENRLFCVTDNGLTEVNVRVFGKPILSCGKTWNVLTNSTKWFDGVGVQDAMGAKYLVVPFGDNFCTLTRVRELDNLQPIAGRAGNRFATVIAIDKKGVYRKLEFSFDKLYQSYKLWQGTVDSSELNVAILPKGVCTTIVEDGKLDIFVPSNGIINSVKDKFISTDMTLANWDNRVVYVKDGKLWHVRMK